MHSRATDRRSAPNARKNGQIRTLDQAFGLAEVLVPVSTSRLSCKRAGKTRTLMPVWDSSGESRIKVLYCFHKNNDDSKCEVAHTLPSSIRRIIQPRVEATPARSHGQAAVGSRLTLSDRFYTPTLTRPDNEPGGWVMSHTIELGCPPHPQRRGVSAAAAVHREG